MENGKIEDVFPTLQSHVILPELLVSANGKYCWFGARWFGFLGSRDERNCYLGVPRFESQIPNHRFPNHQLFITRM